MKNPRLAEYQWLQEGDLAVLSGEGEEGSATFHGIVHRIRSGRSSNHPGYLGSVSIFFFVSSFFGFNRPRRCARAFFIGNETCTARGPNENSGRRLTVEVALSEIAQDARDARRDFAQSRQLRWLLETF